MTPDDLHTMIAELLVPDRGDDYCLNGVQLAGRPIQRAAFAVTATSDTISAALAAGADAVVVHHGVNWSGSQPAILPDSPIWLATQAELSVLAYHLPLDRDPVIGNSVGLLAAIGLAEPVEIPATGGLGFGARYAEPIAGDDWLDRLDQLTSEPVFVAGPMPDHVSSVATVTGAGARYAEPSFANGYDVFLTGELPLSTATYADRVRRPVVAIGHTTSELYGIEALRAAVAERSEIDTVLIPSTDSGLMRPHRPSIYRDSEPAG
ncbi:MAG: Nif3-like dinuclear metal center hexameric protein [Actinomycetota bacterium]